MRYQGKITGWKDDQGFGFVVPNEGGEKAFVHAKAFTSKSRRPSEGDFISYEVSIDIKRRLQAEKIRFVSDYPAYDKPNNNGLFGIAFFIVFCIFLAYAQLNKTIPVALVYLYLAASLLTFIAYWIDKSSAKRHDWRTKESTLHLFGLIGGWPGALLAQRILHHKSRKQEFQRVFWATIIINCALLVWFFTKDGSTFLVTTIDELSRLIYRLGSESWRTNIEWSAQK